MGEFLLLLGKACNVAMKKENIAPGPSKFFLPHGDNVIS